MRSPANEDLKRVGEVREVDQRAEMSDGVGRRDERGDVGTSPKSLARAGDFERGAPHADERRHSEHSGAVTSMVDALEDILKWERASERAMRVARDQSATDLQAPPCLKGGDVSY